MSLTESIMMMRLNLIKFYKKYEIIILAILKFILIWQISLLFKDSLSETSLFHTPYFRGGVALVGAFLSAKWLVITAILLLALEVIQANLMLGLVTLVIFLMAYILFIRFYPKESIIILVMMIAFKWDLGIMLPLIGGIICTSSAGAIAIALGILLWSSMAEIISRLYSIPEQSLGVIDLLTETVNALYQNVILNETVLCSVVIGIVVFFIIYTLKKQSIDYAAYVAIGMGGIMNMIGFSIGILFLEIEVGLLKVVLLTGLGIIISLLIEFFAKALDYSRVEQVQFEDDENYYYVKVVPKLVVNTSKRQIKELSSYDSKEDLEI